MSTWISITIGVFFGLIIGGIAVFFITKHIFEKQLQKNPPMNENMIRAMYMQMGRKPTETQIRNVMQSMRRHQTSATKNKK